MISLSKFLVFIIFVKIFETTFSHRIYNDDLMPDLEEDDTQFTFLVQGGDRIPQANFAKYMVSLRTKNFTKFWGDNHFCAGVIYKLDTIITAASCLEIHGKKDLTVVGGNNLRLLKDETTQVRQVKKVIPYWKFRPIAQVNDIALLILDSPLTATENLQPLRITKSEPTTGLLCLVIGWGSVLDRGPIANNPISANVTVLSFEECQAKWVHLTHKMVCAQDKEDLEKAACTEDGGSPLICTEHLYGIVSFDLGCDNPGYPGVYTSVHYFKDWIERGIASRTPFYTKLYVLYGFIRICGIIVF